MARTPTRLSKQARREQLLDAATAIVRTQGADGLTLVTLAEAAGVSRPIAYDHFGTRPALLLALHQRLDARHRAAITEAVRAAPATAGEVARVISTAYFDCATAMPELGAVSAALRAGPEPAAGPPPTLAGYVDLLATSLRPYAELPADELRLRCVGLLGAAEAIAAERHRGQLTDAAAVAALSALIIGALADGTASAE